VKKNTFSITILGTGTSSGVPMVGCKCAVCASSDPKDKRLRSSVLIQSNTTTIVIDSGPDFRQQMLTNNITHIDAIVFTHPHKDHIAGLDDIRGFNFFAKKNMAVYCNKITAKRLYNEFDYAFAPIRYEGVPLIEMHIIDMQPFTIGDITLTPILVWHYKMPVYGFRIENFVYITDANLITEIEMQKMYNAEVLILNALRKEAHLSHFTLQEAIDLSVKVNAQKTYFTHISHQLGLHQIINQELPNNIQLAYDGLTIQINA
jgi:phosphoribosyl 1,2-cyclic phosphate phosphodiesterase